MMFFVAVVGCFFILFSVVSFVFVVDGYHYIEWAKEIFGTCAYGPVDQASLWIGLSSIAFWLFGSLTSLLFVFVSHSSSNLF